MAADDAKGTENRSIFQNVKLFSVCSQSVLSSVLSTKRLKSRTDIGFLILFSVFSVFLKVSPRIALMRSVGFWLATKPAVTMLSLVKQKLPLTCAPTGQMLASAVMTGPAYPSQAG
jgi:hypothetical protein